MAASVWGEATAIVQLMRALNMKEVGGRNVDDFEKWIAHARDTMLERHWNPEVSSFAVWHN